MTPQRIDTNDYGGARLLNEILSLYYQEELTQAEVARRVGLSTSKVNRLLKRAREQGMVEIVIRVPFQHLFDLENRLEAVFGIGDSVVIPPIAEDVSAMAHTLGRAGASYLLGHLQDGDVIAIGGGTSVNAVVQALETQRSYDIEVVPFLGGVQGHVFTDVNYLATELANRLEGKAYQLHAPAFVDTREERDTILSMRPVKGVLDIARRATVALMGVGTVKPDISRFVEFTALSTEEMERIAQQGGVGEIGAYIYDRRGCPCFERYANRVVGLTLGELKQIPFTIGVAATAIKALPVYGALRGDYLDALITDKAVAQGALELFREDFRGEGASN